MADGYHYYPLPLPTYQLKLNSTVPMIMLRGVGGYRLNVEFMSSWSKVVGAVRCRLSSNNIAV